MGIAALAPARHEPQEDATTVTEETRQSGAPDEPTEMRKRSWWGVLKRTGREFSEDNLTDWAAALTYYAVLSLFPALLALVSILGLLGPSTTQTLIDNLSAVAPGPARVCAAEAGPILETMSVSVLVAAAGCAESPTNHTRPISAGNSARRPE